MATGLREKQVAIFQIRWILATKRQSKQCSAIVQSRKGLPFFPSDSVWQQKAVLRIFSEEVKILLVKNIMLVYD
jgi:hypothetical protein